MHISIAIPSRGLIHSRTVQHVFDNLEYLKRQYGDDVAASIDITHDLPIPECFNALIQSSRSDMLWFVEEDMGFRKETLAGLYEYLLDNLDTIIGATINYPVGEGTHVCSYHKNGDLDTGGMGCLLISKRALKKVCPLRSDIAYDADTGEILDYIKRDKHKVYGQQDIYMYKELYKNGLKIGVLGEWYDGWQYKVEEKGEGGVNYGFHNISVLEFKEEE